MFQKVRIYNNEDPFNETSIEMDLPEGVRILSHEPYVKELYERYEGFLPDKKENYEITNDTIVKGFIVDIQNDVAQVELNKKYSTVIDMKKERKDVLQYIQQDSYIDLKISSPKKTNNYVASVTNAIHDIKKNEIVDAIGKRVAFIATVKELIRGGYYLVIDGIKTFMPGSLAGMNKLINFESILNKQLYVMPINFSTDFNMVVVSHREYLNTIKPLEAEKIKFDVKYTGKITGSSKHGVFAEFNTDSDFERPMLLTGLIPISEMDSETLTKFTSRQYKDNDLIDFYVKSISDDCNKIILSKSYIDWDKIIQDYKIDSTISCTVVKIRENLTFCTIENTQLVGSILNYEEEVNVGDVIKLRISKIDTFSKKVFLKGLVDYEYKN